MIKYRYISTIASAIFLIGIISTVPTLNSCSGTFCDGKKCKAAIGLNANEKPSERDSLFYVNNPSMAQKFRVFVESSASMDGYVMGNTEFKTTLHRLIGQVVADVLENDSNVSLNYINSKIFNRRETPKQFTQNLSASSFVSYSGFLEGGDRANSDIIDVISQVIKNTSSSEISMFISDCVYSPEASADIDKALQKQQTDMLNILKNKSKSQEGVNFGVLVYRLTSDFHGIYYTKTNGQITCNGDRPYFVWFFGKESILANVAESISKIMSDNKAEYIVGIPQYQYLPYKTIKSDHAYHYLSAKTKTDSLYTFSYIADMSMLPLTKEYLLDKDNYKLGKDKYFIKKIETYSDPEKPIYNYKYTICVKGGKNSLVTPTLVEVSLKSMFDDMPNWITNYNDPLGNDYNNGYDSKKLRTFGLKSLVEGIADYYKNPCYVTFKIQIN